MFNLKVFTLTFLALQQLPVLVKADEKPIELLVALAIENDPILKQLDQKVATENLRAGNQFSYPPIQLSYGFFVLPIETRKGPQRQKISVKQVFVWPGLAESVNELPSLKAQIYNLQKALRKRQIRYDVEQLSWTFWHHQRQLELTEAYLVLLDGLLSSTQSLNIIGRLPKSAVSLVSLEKARIIDRYDNEKNEIEVTRTALERWTGMPVKSLSAIPQITENTEEKVNSENHPELLVLEKEDDLDRAKIILEEKADYPKFSIGIDYFEIGENENANSGDDALMAMVGISIPLWSRPSGYEARALRANILARDFLRKNRIREIQSKTEIEALKIRDHSRKISYLENTIIPLAEIYRTDLTAEFETDRAKIQDVILALNSVFRERLKLAGAKANFEKSRSKFAFESGVSEKKP